ncbi:hypothetical protein N7478_012412 [Penicillium angulare]|uniref:uncharacterized protein n=1 Tax=Penicillium angulare TaxID=116970 RepID=UPI0025418487|nr:uncharacterized protein N7478_012412 [Penicillium angulare]KAJ5259431.1 hypothetical protein N7478_012412 [Penicillium angulare]
MTKMASQAGSSDILILRPPKRVKLESQSTELQPISRSNTRRDQDEEPLPKRRLNSSSAQGQEYIDEPEFVIS